MTTTSGPKSSMNSAKMYEASAKETTIEPENGWRCSTSGSNPRATIGLTKATPRTRILRGNFRHESRANKDHKMTATAGCLRPAFN
jgi:hypothetical protein